MLSVDIYYDLVTGSSYILKTREFFQPLFYIC